MAQANYKLAKLAAKISVVVLLVLLVQQSIATNASGSSETTKHQLSEQNDLKQQAQTSESNIEASEPKRASSKRSEVAQGRSGRMLDLDVLAGDIGKQEKAARERSLSGNRQSRNLPSDGLTLSETTGTTSATATQKVEGRSPKKASSKKMSIKGFIPIVSLENGKHFDPSQMMASDSDDDNNDNEGGETDSSGGASQSEQQQNGNNNLREHLANNYGGHTSIGHASFVPTPNGANLQQQQQQQQQFSSEPQWQQMVASQQQQQYLAPQDQMQPEAGRANRKLLGTSSILSGLTGGSIGGSSKRGLVSSLVPSALSSSNFGPTTQYNNPYQQQQQLQQQQQQHMASNHLSGPVNLFPVQAPFGSPLDSSQGGECICVPFFQCKNGYLSESQLSKSQLAQFNQLTSPTAHQIPRSLSNFKTSSNLQQAAATGYNQYPSQQQQQQSQLFTAADQFQQQQQLQQGTQPGQQQQLVNDIIYDQLRKSIEGSNLEQQLQQQEAYNDANQQQLALLDERHAKSAPLNASSSSLSSLSEGEERSLLNSLGNRRQYQISQPKCGIMRTCCRIPPRTTRGANYARPTIASAAARFVNPQQQALTTTSQLIASPSISRPQNQYQVIQAMRAQQQQQQQPTNSITDFGYQLGASPGGNQMADAYQLAVASSAMPLALGSQMQPTQQPQYQPLRPTALQSSGSFMQGRCGMRQTLGISGRVQNSDSQQLANGESTAEFGEFPAHAAILKRLSPGDSLFVCSAVLISSQWLATAAHCVRKSRPDELKVRLGEWDVNRDDEFYPFFESNVREIVVHPDFQPSSLFNDIALIRLEQAVDQQQMPHIAPACLAAPSDQFASSYQSNNGQQQRCWVTGWGKDAFGQQGTFQSVLKKVDLPVVAHQDCELALKYQTKLGKHFRLHSSNICAGGERGKDACEGDGGAGLYCLDPVSGLSKAVGLVSWGVGCGQRGVPGVYVSLAQFNAWIESVVANSGEENVYLDARMNGADLQAFKNIISERSNQVASLNGTTGATETSTTTTAQPPTTTTMTDVISIDEARSANGTHAE